MNILNVHLQVADLKRSEEFYGETLGFKVADSGPQSIELRAESFGEPLLTLTEVANAAPRPQWSTGLFHAAILLPNRKELARVLKRLAERRYRMQGFADHGVNEAIYLADPDGNGIELYADRPQTEWPLSKDGLEMFTKALDVRDLMAELGDDAEDWSGIHSSTTMGHIHLQVSDLGKAEHFYHRTLGFDIMQKTFVGALFLSSDGYHHHIGLNTWSSRGASAAPKESVGLSRFTIGISDLVALRRVQLQCQSSGFALEEIQQAKNALPSLLVRDPDGIEIAFVVQERIFVN
jgi:catechol 2,3-dioxygenase